MRILCRSSLVALPVGFGGRAAVRAGVAAATASKAVGGNRPEIAINVLYDRPWISTRMPVGARLKRCWTACDYELMSTLKGAATETVAGDFANTRRDFRHEMLLPHNANTNAGKARPLNIVLAQTPQSANR